MLSRQFPRLWRAKKMLGSLVSHLRTYLPRKIGRIGVGSYFPLPNRIVGADRLFVGDRLRAGAGAYIHAIKSYGRQTFNPEIHIGNDVYIGPDCYIVAINRIEIQDGCVLSEGVYINDAAHGMDPAAGLIMDQDLIEGGPITLGKGCFIGLRAAIMPGVTLGEHCVVGIGAVVTQSFPPFSKVAGVPARLIGRSREA